VIISVNAYHADGSETWFHVNYDTLEPSIKKIVDRARSDGKLKKKQLQELSSKRCHFNAVIEELLEFDVVEKNKE
jgi:stress response protein SCP2